MSLEFRLKNEDETRKCLIVEINWNELKSKKQKKIYTSLNYMEHVLILASAITSCVSISSFASLIRFPIAITRSAIGLTLLDPAF